MGRGEGEAMLSSQPPVAVLTQYGKKFAPAADPSSSEEAHRQAYMLSYPEVLGDRVPT